MKLIGTPRVVSAEMLNGGIVITFDDDKCAVYSAGLLYALYPDAQQVSALMEPDTAASIPESTNQVPEPKI